MAEWLKAAVLNPAPNWKGGRVVECAGLENRSRRLAIAGSNPAPSAILNIAKDDFEGV